MRTETKTQEWFLRDPRTRKWIRQCLACGQYGRDPNSPQSIPKVNFEKMFPVMELDEVGMCQDCGANVDRQVKI
jgi:rRNA maturation endonuclease Nob1